jgi:RNA polymerase sigma factor (sigma-70 family)
MSPYSELEPIIVSGYSEGCARFGDLGLDLDVFTKRIHAIIEKHLGANPSPEVMINFAKGLHTRDLYLATACAQHCLYPSMDPTASAPSEHAGRAWKVMESTYRGFIRDLARYFFRKGYISQDLSDNILADLFLPDRSGTSRIVSYDGRSSLSTWLRVVISNRAINAKRGSATMQSVEILSDIPDEPALQSIDSELRTKRYHAPLRESLTLACSRLTLRERLILLWRYEDGLQLGQIARLLDIHQSNVTRQLDRLQGKLREHVVEILTTQHGLSLAAIEECLDDIVENPQTIAILEFIKGKQGPSAGPQEVLPIPKGISKNTFIAKPPESESSHLEQNQVRLEKCK